MKISYIHGPGDAFRTFLYWSQGFKDNSLIKQTYSGQFYDLVSENNGRGQVICITPSQPTSDNSFRFDTVRRVRGSGLKHYIRELQYARDVGAKVKQFDPDIVIFTSDFPSYFLDLLPAKPVKLLSMHNTFWQPYRQPMGLKEKILQLGRRFSMRDTNMAVCVSLECQRQVNKTRAPTPIFSVVQIPRLIDNFQDTTVTDPRRLLFVGRVEVNKGVGELIHAFDIIKHEISDLELKIVGGGEGLSFMKDLATQLGLGSHIEFTGRLDASGVGNAYASADLCICPTQWSFNEGLATVPLEAASYGVPTIISHAVPAKEQFGKNAIVFEPGNAEELASRIRQLVTNQEVYMAAKKMPAFHFYGP